MIFGWFMWRVPLITSGWLSSRSSGGCNPYLSKVKYNLPSFLFFGLLYSIHFSDLFCLDIMEHS